MRRGSAGLAPSGGPRQNPFLHLFRLLEAPTSLGLRSLPLSSKPAAERLQISVSDPSVSLPVFSLRGPCGDVGPVNPLTPATGQSPHGAAHYPSGLFLSPQAHPVPRGFTCAGMGAFSRQTHADSSLGRLLRSHSGLLDAPQPLPLPNFSPQPLHPACPFTSGFFSAVSQHPQKFLAHAGCQRNIRLLLFFLRGQFGFFYVNPQSRVVIATI